MQILNEETKSRFGLKRLLIIGSVFIFFYCLIKIALANWLGDCTTKE